MAAEVLPMMRLPTARVTPTPANRVGPDSTAIALLDLMAAEMANCLRPEETGLPVAVLVSKSKPVAGQMPVRPTTATGPIASRRRSEHDRRSKAPTRHRWPTARRGPTDR
jgi:hypothetical protein